MDGMDAREARALVEAAQAVLDELKAAVRAELPTPQLVEALVAQGASLVRHEYGDVVTTNGVSVYVSRLQSRGCVTVYDFTPSDEAAVGLRTLASAIEASHDAEVPL